MAPPLKHTRERMMDAAERLFSRHGFGGVSVEDVTTAVGVQKPDLYNHFRDKNDLYVAVRLRRLNRLTGDLAPALDARPPALDARPPARERLPAVVAALLRNAVFLDALAQREAEGFLGDEARDHLFARSYGEVYRPLIRFIGEAGVPEHRVSPAYEALIGLATHFADPARATGDPGRAAEEVAALWWSGVSGAARGPDRPRRLDRTERPGYPSP